MAGSKHETQQIVADLIIKRGIEIGSCIKTAPR
jgi:hypothetical protein